MERCLNLDLKIYGFGGKKIYIVRDIMLCGASSPRTIIISPPAI